MSADAGAKGLDASASDDVLLTRRLFLEPVTCPMVEAVVRGDRETVERLARARGPEAWPGPELIHRGFGAKLEAVRADEQKRLWGDRLMITRDEPRRIVGSVVFHGRPDETGIAEIGYGVERASQGLGFATEATRACVRWAFLQPCVRAVTATTFQLHRASLRVIEKLGMHLIETVPDGLWGELLVFSIGRDEAETRS